MSESDICNWLFHYKEMKRKAREEVEEAARLERKFAILGIEAIYKDSNYGDTKTEEVKIIETVKELDDDDDDYEYVHDSSCTVEIRKIKKKIIEE